MKVNVWKPGTKVKVGPLGDHIAGYIDQVYITGPTAGELRVLYRVIWWSGTTCQNRDFEAWEFIVDIDQDNPGKVQIGFMPEEKT